MKKTKFISVLLLCAVLTLSACFAAGCFGGKDATDPPDTDVPPVITPDDPDKDDGSDTPTVPVKPQDYTLEHFGLGETPVRININTDGGVPITGAERDQPWFDCMVSVDNAGENDFAATDAEVRVRGNSTANFEKKSYRIKFTEKRSFLGLNDGAECKNWVLLACYKDVSFLRDAAIFEAARTLLGDDGYYSSDFSFAEVSVNGSYNGMYLVAEQQQVNKNRVDVNEPDEGYTGTDIGYLVEYDGLATREDAGTWFTVDYKDYPIRCEDGSERLPSQWPVFFNRTTVTYTIKNDMYGDDPSNTEQFGFISAYIENVFKIAYDAIYNGVYNTFNETYTEIVPSTYTDSYSAISAVIDVRSWVDMFLLQEIACDNDIDWSSFFMSVDMSADGNKKLTFEAPWDFDSGLGMMKGLEDYDKIFSANASTVAMNGLNPFIALPFSADWFREMCAERWNEFIEEGGATRTLGLIYAVTRGYEDEFARNYERWDNLGVYTDEQYQSETVLTFRTQEDAADYLYNWITDRIEFLTNYFADVPPTGN